MTKNELMGAIRTHLRPENMSTEGSIVNTFLRRGYSLDDVHHVVLGLRLVYGDSRPLSLKLVYATKHSSQERLRVADWIFMRAQNAYLANQVGADARRDAIKAQVGL